jgi:predicted peroxiredoxin
VASNADSTSSRVTPRELFGFSDKASRIPAKDAVRPSSYNECVKPTIGEYNMPNPTDKLVVLITRGIDSELSSVAFTIANGAITAGLKVSVFLTSTAIDLVRKRGQLMTHVPPLDPLAALIENFQERGGTIWACTPCVKSRGYEQVDLLEGVIITGASVMNAEIKEGAATLSF